MITLSIAICTRGRPTSLDQCLRAVALAAWDHALSAEVIVVDGSASLVAVDPELVVALRHMSIGIRHLHCPSSTGLGWSRARAVSESLGEIVLFLDDDVEITAGYLTTLLSVYQERPECAGVGGVDTLLGPPTFRAALAGKAFGLDSGHCGRLSRSGFNGSLGRWTSATEPFQTEYLSGCNMSFRKEAIAATTVPDWLREYSLGEDVWWSAVATGRGALWIDPRLEVKHARAAGGRADHQHLAYLRVVNGFMLLGALPPARWRRVAFAWSILGLALIAPFTRPGTRGLRGYWNGFKTVVALAWTEKKLC